jgi:hypothetical protein
MSALTLLPDNPESLLTDLTLTSASSQNLTKESFDSREANNHEPMAHIESKQKRKCNTVERIFLEKIFHKLWILNTLPRQHQNYLLIFNLLG